MCGGTIFHLPTHMAREGLSPLVRGNRRRSARANRTMRSIPACAGEPRPAPPFRTPGTVYPRLCGGTLTRPSCPMAPSGLSPLVRGNPAQAVVGADGLGSIPACAGEPAWRRPRACPRAVYPRLCGGTGAGLARFSTPNGLSPLVRGNRFKQGTGTLLQGSIPACAGEPLAPVGLP